MKQVVLGYSLYKSLTARGVDCIILAPTAIQVSAKNKMVRMTEWML